jgi:Carboxypeptidase regulatory-like domain/TonB dependent receptor-like, beta-barrel
MKLTRVVRMLTVIVWLSGGGLVAAAQTAQLTGRVTDDRGAVVPDVSITVIQVQTGTKRETTSNEEGYFSVPLLPPGQYQLRAVREGFKAVTRSDITLEISQVARLDIKLDVGQLIEVTEVTGSAAAIETDTSALGNVRTQKAISELPINSRNFTMLVQLSAGAVPTSTQASGALPITAKRGVPITSVNGQRPEDNNLMIEGINISENHNGLGIILYPPLDALQEFKVQSNSMDAQYGRAGGAAISVLYKSGGRNFHGNLFEFHRNSVFDAKGFFDPRDQDNPKFILNQFGATLGGPVLLPRFNRNRDKTFFFFAWESMRNRQAQTAVSTVPTEAFRRGDFSAHPNRIFDPQTTQPQGNTFTRTQFPGNVIPPNQLDPVGLNIVALYPLPNLPGIANNYVFNPVREVDGNNYDFKLDQNINANHTLNFRYSHGNTESFEPGSLPAPAVGVGSPTGTNKSPHNQFVAGWNYTLAANLINEMKFGFTRLNLSQLNLNFGRDLSSEVGIPGANTGAALNSGLSILNIAGFRPLGENGFTPAVIVSENWQFNDNFFFVLGRHSMKVGVEAQRRRYNAFQSSSARGTLNFGTGFTSNPTSPAGTGIGLADLLLGLPGSGDIQIITGTRGFRRTEAGLYFQDDYKISPRLTLNLGVRYEQFAGWPWTEVGDRMSQFSPSRGVIVAVGSPDVPWRSGVRPDRNNVSPRAGLAWQIFSQTVIRTAYGVFYNAPPLDITRNLASNPPYVGRFAFTNNQFDLAGARRASQGFSREIVAADAALNAIDFNLRTPYTQQWNLNVQQVLPSSTTLTVAYVGTKGTKLVTRPNINQARPGLGAVASRRPYPQFNDISYWSSQASSIYHGLQVTADKRYANGLSFLASYTWAHAIDNATDLFGSPQNVLDLAADRGNSAFDIRHRFVYSFNYDLPFGGGRRWLRDARGVVQAFVGGWQVNGIVQLYSGFPFTVTTAVNTLNGSGAQRAHVVPGCKAALSGDERTLALWFNTSCFTTPPPFTFGNAGRNTLFGPGTKQFDLSLFKNFQLGVDKARYLQFRAEMFNAFNTPQFNNPNSNVGAPGAGSITSAGSIVTFQRTPRQIQFALKLYY